MTEQNNPTSTSVSASIGEPKAEPTGEPAMDAGVVDAGVEDAEVEDAGAMDGSFGDPRVDAAVEQLSRLEQRPVADHVDVFDEVHGRLRHALAEVADDQGSSRPG